MPRTAKNRKKQLKDVLLWKLRFFFLKTIWNTAPNAWCLPCQYSQNACAKSSFANYEALLRGEEWRCHSQWHFPSFPSFKLILLPTGPPRRQADPGQILLEVNEILRLICLIWIDDFQAVPVTVEDGRHSVSKKCWSWNQLTNVTMSKFMWHVRKKCSSQKQSFSAFDHLQAIELFAQNTASEWGWHWVHVMTCGSVKKQALNYRVSVVCLLKDKLQAEAHAEQACCMWSKICSLSPERSKCKTICYTTALMAHSKQVAPSAISSDTVEGAPAFAETLSDSIFLELPYKESPSKWTKASIPKGLRSQCWVCSPASPGKSACFVKVWSIASIKFMRLAPLQLQHHDSNEAWNASTSA